MIHYRYASRSPDSVMIGKLKVAIPISINFLTNTCKVIFFISKNLLEIAFLVQNIRPVNQDLIRKHMLFGIGQNHTNRRISYERKWKTLFECYTLLVHGLLTGTEDFSDSLLVRFI